MITAQSSIDIGRSVEDVFAFVTNPRNEPRWHTDVQEATVTSEGPIGVGTTSRWVLRFLGRKEGIMEVTAYDPPNKAELTARSGPMKPTITYLFEPVDGGTRFTRRVDVEPGGPFRLMAPMMRRQIPRRNGQFLVNLKRVLETG